MEADRVVVASPNTLDHSAKSRFNAEPVFMLS